MKLKGLVEYDISNYGVPSMFLIFPYCSFKCDHEYGKPVCQNSSLAREPIIEIEPIKIIERYLKNPLTHAVVCGGLEPFDSKDDLYVFMDRFRRRSQDPIIIYTGYTEKELIDEIPKIRSFGKVIIKYGRYIPNMKNHYDGVLGVNLASDNQYAIYYE